MQSISKTISTYAITKVLLGSASAKLYAIVNFTTDDNMARERFHSVAETIFNLETILYCTDNSIEELTNCRKQAEQWDSKNSNDYKAFAKDLYVSVKKLETTICDLV